MEQKGFWLRLINGQKRFARGWWPSAAEPSTIVCVVPGLGEHSGRYTPFAAHLVNAGFGVVSLDVQGQGLSPGWRGCITSYDDLLGEVAALVRFARGGEALRRVVVGESWGSDEPVALEGWPEERKLPVCLYGHSMGGNLVLSSAMRGVADPDRIIASGPMLRAVHPPTPSIIRLARILKMVAPHFCLRAPVRKEFLSHIESETEAYAKDPLVHRRVSLRLGAALIDSGQWLLNHAQKLQTPCLMLHGGDDRITDPDATRQFAKAALLANAASRLTIYPGMLHDIHRDIGREHVVADIIEWCR